MIINGVIISAEQIRVFTSAIVLEDVGYDDVNDGADMAYGVHLFSLWRSGKDPLADLLPLNLSNDHHLRAKSLPCLSRRKDLQIVAFTFLSTIIIILWMAFRRDYYLLNQTFTILIFINYNYFDTLKSII